MLFPDPDPDPKRAHIGNVFPVPKKHRRPHFDKTAERWPMDFGARRDQPREDRSALIIRDLRIIEYVIYNIHVIYIIQVSLPACRHKS